MPTWQVVLYVAGPPVAFLAAIGLGVVCAAGKPRRRR